MSKITTSSLIPSDICGEMLPPPLLWEYILISWVLNVIMLKLDTCAYWLLISPTNSAVLPRCSSSSHLAWLALFSTYRSPFFLFCWSLMLMNSVPSYPSFALHGFPHLNAQFTPLFTSIELIFVIHFPFECVVFTKNEHFHKTHKSLWRFMWYVVSPILWPVKLCENCILNVCFHYMAYLYKSGFFHYFLLLLSYYLSVSCEQSS